MSADVRRVEDLPVRRDEADPPDLDLGDGITARFTHYNAERFPEAPNPAGLVLEHPSATSPTGRCAGAVFWWRPPVEVARGLPIWTRVSVTPLELSPSVRCHCGWHGWIRGGHWIPA